MALTEFDYKEQELAKIREESAIRAEARLLAQKADAARLERMARDEARSLRAMSKARRVLNRLGLHAQWIPAQASFLISASDLVKLIERNGAPAAS